MRGLTKSQTARGILPYLATILSISLAVTLRVERACSDSSSPTRLETPPVLYPYPEVISNAGLARRHADDHEDRPTSLGVMIRAKEMQ